MKKFFCLVLGIMLCLGLFGCGEQGSKEIDLSQYSEEELLAMRDQIDELLSADESTTQNNTSEISDNGFNVSAIDKTDHETLQSYLSNVGKVYSSDEFDTLLENDNGKTFKFLGQEFSIEYSGDVADEKTGEMKINKMTMETSSYVTDEEYKEIVEITNSYFGKKYDVWNDNKTYVEYTIETYTVGVMHNTENDHLSIIWNN